MVFIILHAIFPYSQVSLWSYFIHLLTHAKSCIYYHKLALNAHNNQLVFCTTRLQTVFLNVSEFFTTVSVT